MKNLPGVVSKLKKNKFIYLFFVKIKKSILYEVFKHSKKLKAFSTGAFGEKA